MTEEDRHTTTTTTTMTATSSQEVLRDLKEWFLAHGGVLNKVDITPINETEGCGLLAHQPIPPGESVLHVPLSLCLHIDALAKSILHPIITTHEPHLQEAHAQDELLALMLMAERKAGPDSYWWNYLRIMPHEYDTPLYWSEEERKHLAGTNVGLLTTMMEKRIAQDWEEIHVELVEKYPQVLGGLTLKDYTWALSTIWSRAVGVDVGVGSNTHTDTQNSKYLRVLAPALDMCNHHPTAASSSLAEILKYDTETDALVFTPSSGGGGGGGGATIQPGSQCYLFYGPYSNAKLLYSYGFVAPHNPHRGVDYWVKVPPTALDAEWKNEQLHTHTLTQEQTYDFQGTLRGNGVTLPLMATVRMIHLLPEEYGDVEKIFKGECVSVRNEKASFEGLVGVLERKVKGYATTIEEDLLALGKVEKVLENAQGQVGEGEGEEGGGEMGLRIGVLLAAAGRRGEKRQGENEENGERGQQQQHQQQHQQQRGEVPPKASLRRALRRRAYALKVVLEDKLVVQETLACVKHRLEELRVEEEVKEQGLD